MAGLEVSQDLDLSHLTDKGNLFVLYSYKNRLFQNS